MIVSIKTALSGSGRNVVIQSHNGTLQTLYFHLSRIDVIQGQYVSEGQVIGAIGASGRGSEKGYASHLHYAIKMNDGTGHYNWYDPTEGRGNSYDNIIDPMNYINFIGPRTQEYYSNKIETDIRDFLFDPRFYATYHSPSSPLKVPTLTPKQLPVTPRSLSLPEPLPVVPSPLPVKPLKQPFRNKM